MGRWVALRAVEGPAQVHFWATWCPPCRAELPGLLAAAGELPVKVVTVALDPRWSDVDRFLGGLRPADMFLAEGAEVERLLGVTTLPVTYLVGSDGTLRLRFDGARDWRSSRFRLTWLSELGDRED